MIRIWTIGPPFLLKICIIFSSWCSPLLTSAQQPARGLQWPLPIHEGCTSGFGESRGNHLHGGVDFRTHQEEGWPLFAPADCSVERIRREPHGYGRVIYLKLDDGRTAVYGHLIRFENEALRLEDRLVAACKKAGTSFPSDIWFNPPARVKAGDIVAYSGELGVGFPHLHMEIRRETELLDPFAEGLPVPEGLKKPVFTGLIFLPRDSSSLVEGSFEPVFIRALLAPDGVYALERPVALNGRFDVLLLCNDMLGIDDQPVGPSNVEASLSGRTFFKMALTRFDLKQTFQGPLLWDGGWNIGDTAALLLRKEPALTVGGVEGEGLPEITGSHAGEILVKVCNRAGETSTLRGSLQYSESAAPARLGLPGCDFRVRSKRVLPSGLMMELVRGSADGITPLLLGGKPAPGLLVEEGQGDILKVLVPAEAITAGGAWLSFGDPERELLVGKGPGRMSYEKMTLELPDGAAAVVTPPSRKTAPSELPGTGAFVQVGPAQVKGRASITYKGVAPSRSLGVYAGEGYSFVELFDGSPCKIGADGYFSIRRDREKPEFGNHRFHKIPNLEIPEVRLKVSDEASGIDAKSMKIRLDGKAIYPDWDGDGGEIRIDISGLKKGKHSIKASISDRAGNRAQKSYRFVKR